MKRILAFVTGLVLLCPLFGFSATLTNSVAFNLTDFLQVAYTNRTVTIQSLSTPRTNPPYIAVNYFLSTNSGATAAFTLTNLLDGTYRVSIVGSPNPTAFSIYVPTNNGGASAIHDASGLLTTNIEPNSTIGWTRNQANSRFVQFPGGTNIFFVTNAAGVTAHVKTNSGSGSVDTSTLLSNLNSFGTNITLRGNTAITGGSIGLGNASFPLYFSNDVFSGFFRSDFTDTNYFVIGSHARSNLSVFPSGLILWQDQTNFGAVQHRGNVSFAGSAAFDSLSVTNALLTRANLGLAIGTNVMAQFSVPNIIYVRTNGNDTNAVIGDISRPWATVTNAFTFLTSGATVDIGAGRYTVWPKGRYRSEGFAVGDLAPLRIHGVSNVTIRGHAGAEIFGSGASNFLTIQQVTNLTLENITLTGDRPALGAGAIYGAIVSWGTNRNIRLLGVTIQNMGDHGYVDLQDANGDRNTENVLIDGCRFAFIGGGTNYIERDGVAVGVGKANWKYLNSTFENNLRDIEFEGIYGGYVGTNYLVQGCTFRGTRDFSICSFEDSGTTNNFVGVQILDNHFSNIRSNITGPASAGLQGTPIYATGAKNWRIAGNTLDGFTVYGIELLASNGDVVDNVIEDNLVMNSDGAFGTLIGNVGASYIATRNRIAGNTYRYIVGETIALDGNQTRDNVVERNNVSHSGGTAAIQVSTGANNNIFRDNFHNGGTYGTSYGIIIYGGITNTLLSGNVFISNSIAAISDTNPTTMVINHRAASNAVSVAPNIGVAGGAVTITNGALAGATNTGVITGTAGAGITNQAALSATNRIDLVNAAGVNVFSVNALGLTTNGGLAVTNIGSSTIPSLKIGTPGEETGFSRFAGSGIVSLISGGIEIIQWPRVADQIDSRPGRQIITWNSSTAPSGATGDIGIGRFNAGVAYLPPGPSNANTGASLQLRNTTAAALNPPTTNDVRLSSYVFPTANTNEAALVIAGKTNLVAITSFTNVPPTLAATGAGATVCLRAIIVNAGVTNVILLHGTLVQ